MKNDRINRQNRELIDGVIRNVRDGVKPAHYLAYDHSAGCMCYTCQQRRKSR